MLCNIKQCLLKTLWTRSQAWASISPMADRHHSCVCVCITNFVIYLCINEDDDKNSVDWLAEWPVDLLSFRINSVGFSDDDNLCFILCMPISRQNLWTIWSAFQHGIPQKQNCHWAKSCATLRDDTEWINENQFRSETCHLQQWTRATSVSQSTIFELIDIKSCKHSCTYLMS